MKKYILGLITLSCISFAHDDHGPSPVQAPKGGIIRSLETIHLELLTEDKLTQIYVYDHHLKPSQTKLYPVSATVTLPKKKAVPLKLTDAGDHWIGHIDAQKAHRYTLELAIKQGGHNDKVTWVVEPKK